MSGASTGNPLGLTDAEKRELGDIMEAITSGDICGDGDRQEMVPMVDGILHDTNTAVPNHPQARQYQTLAFYTQVGGASTSAYTKMQAKHGFRFKPQNPAADEAAKGPQKFEFETEVGGGPTTSVYNETQAAQGHRFIHENPAEGYRIAGEDPIAGRAAEEVAKKEAARHRAKKRAEMIVEVTPRLRPLLSRILPQAGEVTEYEVHTAQTSWEAGKPIRELSPRARALYDAFQSIRPSPEQQPPKLD